MTPTHNVSGGMSFDNGLTHKKLVLHCDIMYNTVESIIHMGFCFCVSFLYRFTHYLRTLLKTVSFVIT